MSECFKTAIFRLVSNGSEKGKVWCSCVLDYPKINKTYFFKYMYIPIRVTVHPTRGKSSAHPAINQLDLYLSIEKSEEEVYSQRLEIDGDFLCHEIAIMLLMQ